MENFKVSGFKVINKEKEFCFAPITLLVGPNGSGKSTVLKALKTMKNILHHKERFETNPTPYSNRKSGISLRRSPGQNQTTIPLVNVNSKDHSIVFVFPFPLAYFPDKFEMKLKYEFLDQEFVLSNVEILNKNKGSALLSVATRRHGPIEDKNISDAKIDYPYIYHFLEDRLRGLPENPTSIFDLISPDQPTTEEIDWMMEQQYKDSQEPMKNFYDLDKLSLKERNARNDFSWHLDDLLYDIRNGTYFDFIEKELSGSDRFAAEQELIEKMTSSETRWAGIHNRKYSAAEIIQSILENSLSNFSETHRLILSDFESTKDIQDGKKLKFLNKYLLKENIEFALSSLYQELYDLTYIPPNRFKSYGLDSAVNEFGELGLDLLTKINDIKAEDWWSEPIENFIRSWLEEFNIDASLFPNNISDVWASLQSGGKTVDLGFGLNQLLPLIYYCSIFNAKGSPVYGHFEDLGSDIAEKSRLRTLPGYTFLIEEPEANLHPNFQSKLADLFIDAAWRFNHRFIIETHSEYMVRKFQYWVAKGKIRPEDVKIYYFSNHNHEELIRDVEIKEIKFLRSGDLSEPFGDGFYDEAINLQYDLLKIKRTQEN